MKKIFNQSKEDYIDHIVNSLYFLFGMSFMNALYEKNREGYFIEIFSVVSIYIIFNGILLVISVIKNKKRNESTE